MTILVYTLSNKFELFTKDLTLFHVINHNHTHIKLTLEVEDFI